MPLGAGVETSDLKGRSNRSEPNLHFGLSPVRCVLNVSTTAPSPMSSGLL